MNRSISMDVHDDKSWCTRQSNHTQLSSRGGDGVGRRVRIGEAMARQSLEEARQQTEAPPRRVPERPKDTKRRDERRDVVRAGAEEEVALFLRAASVEDVADCIAGGGLDYVYTCYM